MKNDPAMGNLGYEREKLDWYPTPDWVTDVLFNNVEITTFNIWEPACGEGHISEKLIQRYPTKFIQSTDIVDRGYKKMYKTMDFINVPWEDIAPSKVCPWSIVTNPPYGKLLDPFIQRALDYTQPHGGMVALLMRNEVDCAASRFKFFGGNVAFDKKIVLLKRPRWYEYKPGDAGPRHNYAWYVWNWSRNPAADPTIIYDK